MPDVFSRKSEPKPTAAWDAYWRLAAERQEIFFKRLAGLPPPWTNDPVLAAYRFTNAYRASDRASQFLIRDVQYAGLQDAENLFFRTVLFKLFNLPSTWRGLCAAVGDPRAETFDAGRYAAALEKLSAAGPIYSAAYLMPSRAGGFSDARKHVTHLRLLAWMLKESFPEKIAAARTLAESFSILRAVPGFGDFLAFQLATDLNYSRLTDFPEAQFCVAGPGARSGVAKCFSSLGDFTETDVLFWAHERQAAEFARLGLKFRDLWGRPLQPIDCQNLFCETDKYCRAALPELSGRDGRTHMKRGYAGPQEPLPRPFYPPRWGLDTARIPGA